jgi:dihydrofolate reductase
MGSSASAGRVASAVLDPRRWWALALLCGAFFMVLPDGTITIGIGATTAWLIGDQVRNAMSEQRTDSYHPRRLRRHSYNTNQKEEQTMMTIHEYLMKAVQDDARRARERDRLLREARRARRARRQRLVPAAPARRRTEMGKIVVSENVTLDRVIQDPARDEGFRAGGWVGLIGNSPQLAKLALDEALAARALLLGRRSYEWLAERWSSRSGELADRLNSLPKYVVSATLASPAWNNSTVLKGDVLDEVSTLKQHMDGDIVIVGSFRLVRTLIEHHLVDELRLKIFPAALGVGERLFGETSDKKPMRLVDTQTLEGGIAYLTYQSVRDA